MIFSIALILSVIMVMALAVPAFAADPTQVVVNWTGAGVVGGTVDTGDAYSTFHSQGTTHTGQYSATDSNDNPYGYGVDTNTFTMQTGITGSGWAELFVNRTDSKVSMYGAPGQESYTFVGVTNGAATLQNRSNTNYASMRDSNYGWNSNDHITVTGADAYALQRYVLSGPGSNLAEILANGSGSADLDCMSSEASAGQVRLGWGCGCYTNADFVATGSGQMQLNAWGNNNASTAMAPGMVGATSFNFVANWVSSTFSVADYSTTAN